MRWLHFCLVQQLFFVPWFSFCIFLTPNSRLVRLCFKQVLYIMGAFSESPTFAKTHRPLVYIPREALLLIRVAHWTNSHSCRRKLPNLDLISTRLYTCYPTTTVHTTHRPVPVMACGPHVSAHIATVAALTSLNTPLVQYRRSWPLLKWDSRLLENGVKSDIEQAVHIFW